jgi:hypothetical protein
MKRTLTSCLPALALFAALEMPLGVGAQDKTAEANTAQQHHYKLIDTGTLGGASSSLGFEGERDISNRGTVVSLAETQIPDPFAPRQCSFPDTARPTDGPVRNSVDHSQ